MKRQRLDLGAQADRFVAELFGESDPSAPAVAADRFGGREPFFGDEQHDCWKVVARPGSHGSDGFSGLRPTDLIVRRSTSAGDPSWVCVPGAGADLRSIYAPGSDTVLRDGVVILRRVWRRKVWPFGEQAADNMG